MWRLSHSTCTFLITGTPTPTGRMHKCELFNISEQQVNMLCRGDNAHGQLGYGVDVVAEQARRQHILRTGRNPPKVPCREDTLHSVSTPHRLLYFDHDASIADK